MNFSTRSFLSEVENGAKMGLVLSRFAMRRFLWNRFITSATDGYWAVMSASSSREITKSMVSSVQMTLAVRGASDSSAISPKKVPSLNSASTTCPCSVSRTTFTRPWMMMKMAWPGSPSTMSASSALATRRSMRSVSATKASRGRSEKSGIGGTLSTSISYTGPCCGEVSSSGSGSEIS